MNSASSLHGGHSPAWSRANLQAPQADRSSSALPAEAMLNMRLRCVPLRDALSAKMAARLRCGVRLYDATDTPPAGTRVHASGLHVT
jgi:hypothetical protein